VSLFRRLKCWAGLHDWQEEIRPIVVVPRDGIEFTTKATHWHGQACMHCERPQFGGRLIVLQQQKTSEPVGSDVTRTHLQYPGGFPV